MEGNPPWAAVIVPVGKAATERAAEPRIADVPGIDANVPTVPIGGMVPAPAVRAKAPEADIRVPRGGIAAAATKGGKTP